MRQKRCDIKKQNFQPEDKPMECERGQERGKQKDHVEFFRTRGILNSYILSKLEITG